MIQYLQRLKHKKGFTLVELAVVVGIIVVLTAIIMVNMLGGDTEKILAANSNAKVFFTASQLTLTRIEPVSYTHLADTSRSRSGGSSLLLPAPPFYHGTS